MSGKDLLINLGNISPKYYEEAETETFVEPGTQKTLKRPLLVAAIIALMLLLLGCGAAVCLVLAEEPWASIPRVEGADVSRDDIQITITQVTPTGLTYHCDIAGFGEAERSVILYNDGPCTLEKLTDSGWQPLPRQITDAQWKADEVLTDGHHDGKLQWAASYGYLDTGRYRVTASVVKGHDDFVLEFEITDAMWSEGLELAEELANREYWHIRESYVREYGPLDNVPDEAKEQFTREDDGADDYSEYWKCGEDFLYLMYDGDNIIMGMMYRDGVKYKLVREWESNDAPIVGWMPWPDMDLDRLTDWAYTLSASQGQKDISYGSDGRIESVVLTSEEDGSNGFDVTVTYTTTLQVMPTSREDIRKTLEAQNTNVWQTFSWEEDQKVQTPLDISFVNTVPSPISTAADALALAEKECIVEYTQVKIYRDEAAGIWKIEYQILYGYQGYQYVYLNDDGITVMISGAGSKVEQWQENYPGP